MNSALTTPMLLAVAGGGAIGSVVRYVIGVVLHRAGNGFPVSTLLINVVGSFLIGLFARLFEAPDHNQLLRVALTVGLCGGFTTFSSFSAETLALAGEGRVAAAAGYVALSLAAGLGAAALGLAAGRAFAG